MQEVTHIAKIKSTTLRVAAKAVSRNIHVVRKENQLSVRDMAEITGLAESTIRRAEKAYRSRRPYNPKLSTLVKFSQATGASLTEVATELWKPVT